MLRSQEREHDRDCDNARNGEQTTEGHTGLKFVEMCSTFSCDDGGATDHKFVQINVDPGRDHTAAHG